MKIVIAIALQLQAVDSKSSEVTLQAEKRGRNIICVLLKWLI